MSNDMNKAAQSLLRNYRQGMAEGIAAAADWVEKQREAYDDEHGRTDPDTNAFEFGNDAQREYSSTLAEIAEGIRALHPAPSIPAVPGSTGATDHLPPPPMPTAIPTPAPEYGDAYQGAREDLAIWKRRALEAERQKRDLVMMVKLLVRTERKYNPESQQAKDFLAYLQREGLISTSDILRDGAKDPE